MTFIKETFTSIVGKTSKLPINEFIKFYDNKMDQGWLKSIIGNLIPFITFLSLSIFASHIDNISTSISFFESQLAIIPSSKYQQTKEDLFVAVKSSFVNQTGGWDHHPLNSFLTTNHEVKRQFNNGWLLNLLGSEGAGKKYKGIVLESNVKYIATILYSIVCITRNKDAIELLALSLGAEGGSYNRRKRYLDNIAQDTVHQYFQIQSTSRSNGTTNSDNATTTTASLTQLSSSESNNNSSCCIGRQAPPTISTNIGIGSSNVDSPLTMPSSLETATMSSELSTRFAFTSPLKVAQHSSHNCNGNGNGNGNRDDNRDCDLANDDDCDGDGDGMSIFSPPPILSSLFLPTSGQVTKRGRYTGTPIMTPSSRGNCRVLFGADFSLSSSTTTKETPASLSSSSFPPAEEAARDAETTSTAPFSSTMERSRGNITNTQSQSSSSSSSSSSSLVAETARTTTTTTTTQLQLNSALSNSASASSSASSLLPSSLSPAREPIKSATTASSRRRQRRKTKLGSDRG